MLRGRRFRPTRTAPRSGRPPRARTALLVALAGLAIGCGVALPFAPVTTPVVTVDWPSSPAAIPTALPLMPYQPVSLDASVTCASARSTSGTVLATTPPGAGDPRGLTVRSDGPAGRVRVASFGRELAPATLPPGDCTVAVSSTARATTVTVVTARTAPPAPAAPPVTVAAATDDVRPVVAGVFTAAPRTDGLRLRLVTDTRFQTTPSALKWWLLAGCLAGGAGLLLVAAWVPRRRVGGVARRVPRTGRVVDAAVVVVLVGWGVVGPASVDDGYLASMIRSRPTSGFLGNVHRWLNAPEAPFSWYAEVHAAWLALAPWPAPVWWLRVPGLVLGLVTWLLLSRAVLPRLGPAGRRPVAPALATVAFAVWWLPFGMTLRPEPWVAAGGLAVWVLAERAVATRRLLPFLGAVTVAAWTVAVTPSGLVALVPLLVAVPTGVRAAVAAGPGRTGVALLSAAGVAATAVVPMVGDQSLAAVLESTRVRQVVGVGGQWTEEYRRWTSLLTPGDMGGSLAFRAPVLVLLVAVAAVAVHLALRRPRGPARGASRRLVLAGVLSLVALVPSPTKWPLHFGAVGGIGAAVLVLLLLAWAPGTLRARDGLAAVGVLGALVMAGVLVFSGFDNWAWVSDWGVPWNDRAPLVAGVPVADIGLVGGPLLLLAAVVVVTARRARQRPDIGAALRVALAPGVWTLVLLAGVVALLLGSFASVPVKRAGSYSIGGADLASLARPSCGLADRLAVEPDPVAGLLGPVPGADVREDRFGPPGPGAVPLTVAGRTLPGWTATSGGARLRSGWFRLTDEQRRGTVPVVTTVSGTAGPRQAVWLEFAATPDTPIGGPVPLAPTPTSLGRATAPRDLRALAPAGALLVRVGAVDDGLDGGGASRTTSAGELADTPLAVGRPRSPRLVRFDQVVAPGTPVLTDWAVALPFPCAPMPALSEGTAAVPGWRLSAPGLGGYGDLVVGQGLGGPFATARELVTEQRIPTYLDGDPLRDPVGLLRWVPNVPYSRPTLRIGARTTSGTESTGRATVPGLDP